MSASAEMSTSFGSATSTDRRDLRATIGGRGAAANLAERRFGVEGRFGPGADGGRALGGPGRVFEG